MHARLLEERAKRDAERIKNLRRRRRRRSRADDDSFSDDFSSSEEDEEADSKEALPDAVGAAMPAKVRVLPDRFADPDVYAEVLLLQSGTVEARLQDQGQLTVSPHDEARGLAVHVLLERLRMTNKPHD